MYPRGTVITYSTFFFTEYENECLSLCSTVVVLYIIRGGKRGHTPHLNEKLKSINIC